MSAASSHAAGGELATLVTHPITYPVTQDEIAKLRAEYVSLAGRDANDAQVYESIRVGIGKLRTLRTAIEKRRKDLKQGALDYGRNVDAAAKSLTGSVSELEDPLQAMKDAVDAEHERKKIEQEKAEVIALEAKIKAEREAEEARVKAEQEAAAAKLAEERAVFEEAKKKADIERAAEEGRRAEEQAKLDAQRAEIDAASRKLRAEQDAAARVEKERKDAAAREEGARLAAIQAEKDAADAAALAVVEAARLEALRPDLERVRAWGKAIRDFAGSEPDVASDECSAAVAWARQRLLKTADELEGFQPGP